MKNEIIKELTSHIRSQIIKQPEMDLQPDDKIISSGLIDSFHLVDISLFIEDQYGVLIDDAELNAATFDSINELADIIVLRIQ